MEKNRDNKFTKEIIWYSHELYNDYYIFFTEIIFFYTNKIKNWYKAVIIMIKINANTFNGLKINRRKKKRKNLTGSENLFLLHRKCEKILLQIFFTGKKHSESSLLCRIYWFRKHFLFAIFYLFFLHFLKMFSYFLS